MKKEEFEKGIKEMKNIQMTSSEKEVVLKNIFAQPIASPYIGKVSVFSYLKKSTVVAVVFSLVFVLVSGSVVYAAEQSLPGDKLYYIKTEVLEPMIDTLNVKPEKQLAWEEKKVERRIKEAEKLVARNKLDENKVIELEEKIEKSSQAFAVFAEKTASSTATTSEGHKIKVEKLKNDFVEKLGDTKEKKVKQLKEAAMKGLESKSEKGKGQNKGR